MNQFETQMSDHFYSGINLKIKLTDAMTGDDFIYAQKEILDAYSTQLGLSQHRDYYILDMNGEYLEGSNVEEGKKLTKSPNLISAMGKLDGKEQLLGSEFTDFAIYLENDGKECIIYIKDTQEQMSQLIRDLLTLILVAILFGLVVAIILSFLLAKAITSPIQNITKGAQLITAGKFTEKLDVHAKDEIGFLTDAFNEMQQVIESKIDEVTGEQQKLEMVLSYLEDAVIAFSANGKVIQINKSALDLFGENYDTDFNFDKMIQTLGIKYDKKNTGINEVHFEEKILDITFSPLKYMEQNKSCDGKLIVIHDVSSRYELDKSRREFVANVSHELKTPLTVIRTYVESVLMYPDMTIETKEEFLKVVIESSDHMHRIIDDLLTLVRVDNKKTQWIISSFDTNEFLKHTCDMMKTDTNIGNKQIIYYENENLPCITADKDRIKQVIINIISNAIKYTKDDGIIRVGCVNDEDIIIIKILDNGIGIPNEDQLKIFDRFYRVEKSRTSDAGGTGLGLAIAKEYIEAHGGRIGLRSKLNKGTEVTIELPITTVLEGDDNEKI